MPNWWRPGARWNGGWTLSEFVGHRTSEFRTETFEHLRAIHAEIEAQLEALKTNNS